MELEDFNKKLLAKIRERLKEKRISMYRLGQDVPVSSRTVMNYLYGDVENPGVDTILKICDYLDIKITIE